MNAGIMAVSLALGLAAPCLATPYPEEAGPQGPVAPNINAFGNPTAPAQIPTYATGDPNAPTFPSGRTNPAWRGGTIGDRAQPKRDWQRGPDERAPMQPQHSPHTGLPPTDVVSPGAPQPEPNPGALEGGPQP